jgi:hypothetical protein
MMLGDDRAPPSAAALSSRERVDLNDLSSRSSSRSLPSSPVPVEAPETKAMNRLDQIRKYTTSELVSTVDEYCSVTSMTYKTPTDVKRIRDMQVLLLPLLVHCTD